jgi:hypothetical protein
MALPTQRTMLPTPPKSWSPERLSFFHWVINDDRRSWKRLLSIVISSAMVMIFLAESDAGVRREMRLGCRSVRRQARNFQLLIQSQILSDAYHSVANMFLSLARFEPGLLDCRRLS